MRPHPGRLFVCFVVVVHLVETRFAFDNRPPVHIQDGSGYGIRQTLPQPQVVHQCLEEAEAGRLPPQTRVNWPDRRDRGGRYCLRTEAKPPVMKLPPDAPITRVSQSDLRMAGDVKEGGRSPGYTTGIIRERLLSAATK